MALCTGSWQENVRALILLSMFDCNAVECYFSLENLSGLCQNAKSLRSKVKHELITSEPTRKVTFKKRKAGVLKKLKELTTLCGVLACAIIFGTNNNGPDCWPSPSGVHRVLDRLKKLPPTKQGKYMFNQEMFLEKHISKLNEKLKKQRQKNQSLASDLIVAECLADNHSLNLSCFENMNDIADILEEKIRFFTNKIKLAKNFNSDEVSPQNNEK